MILASFLFLTCLYWTLRFLSFAVHITEVCVLMAPLLSNTIMFAYLFWYGAWGSIAILAIMSLIEVFPGYISLFVAE